MPPGWRIHRRCSPSRSRRNRNQAVVPGREQSERTRNLEFPRCAIAHLRSGPSDDPGMTLSPRAHQRQGLVALEQIEQAAQGTAARARQFWILLHDAERLVAGLRDELAVYLGSRDPIAGKATLPDAQHITFTAQLQILLGDAKSVRRFPDHAQPCFRDFAKRLLVKQKTRRGLRAAANSPTQLMQLRKPESLGILDHHD